MVTSHVVTSPLLGDYAAYQDLDMARRKCGELNRDLFNQLVYDPLVEVNFVCSMGYERCLNENYNLTAYSVNSCTV